jgi:hypothetical protein
MTRTEEFVYNLCNRTFLSLWSFPNPIGKKGKELCDVLIICEPDIIIFSVKEINIKNSGDLNLDIERWLDRAINSSSKQVYGAERYLKSTEKIILKDRTTEIDLTKNINWRYHRVSVAFGRGKRFPLRYGDFGNGFVHVFDEKSVSIVLSELDTIKDFVNYLESKENLVREMRYPLSFGEEDMLAYYLSNNFSFPKEADFIYFGDDLYQGLSSDKSYLKILKDLEVSYKWDNLIEKLIEDFNNGELVNDISRKDLELTVRQMAREDRNSRKMLSEQFLDFIGVTSEPKSRSRIVKSFENEDTIYVFLLGDYKDRVQRARELQMRSFVARSKFECKVIIGLATEKYNPKGYSLDFSYSYYPEFSDDLREKATEISNALGYFKTPQITEVKDGIRKIIKKSEDHQ